MLDLMTLYTTQRKLYLWLSDQSNHRVRTRQESGSEMKNLALESSFVTQDKSWLQTVEIIRILKNNSVGKMQLAICWSGSSHLHLRRKKSNCSNHIVTQFMDVLFGVILTRTLSENLLISKSAHLLIGRLIEAYWFDSRSAYKSTYLANLLTLSKSAYSKQICLP